jgi:hypothetical protein
VKFVARCYDEMAAVSGDDKLEGKVKTSQWKWEKEKSKDDESLGL